MNLHIGRFHGEVRPDGSAVGFDYGRQQWVDTKLTAPRDVSAPPGSAANPLSSIPPQS
jgi:hypothetical protein